MEALAPGGVIILDDYFNEMWPGVSEGVDRDFREPRGILPFATGANKTFFCASGAIPLYVDSLRSIATKTLEHDFLGARILCCDFAPLPFTERVGKDSRWHTAPLLLFQHRGGQFRVSDHMRFDALLSVSVTLD